MLANCAIAAFIAAFIGAFFGRITKGMNIGQVGVGIVVAIICAFAGGVVGLYQDSVLAPLLVGAILGPVMFAGGRRIWA